MLTNNPFADLSVVVSPAPMQTYVAIMFVLVVGGTLYDVVHKRSAAYFFQNWRKAKEKGGRQIGSSELMSIAGKKVVVDVLTSCEFCNQNRRIAHLLTMYGFLAYVIATAIMVFYYPTHSPAAPALLPLLWHLGALMVAIGGFFFCVFFFADPPSQGNSPVCVVRGDLFIPPPSHAKGNRRCV